MMPMASSSVCDKSMEALKNRNDHICETCRKMILNAVRQLSKDSTIDELLWRDDGYNHIFAPKSAESDYSNCYICLHMYIAVQDAKQEVGDSSEHLRFGFYMYQQPTPVFDGYYLCIRIYLQASVDETDELSLIDRLFQINKIDRTDQLQATAYSSSIQTSSGSNQSLKLASTWLQECTQSHTRCHSTKSPWFPSRLLHLSASKARLISPHLEPPSSPYATLSHCWGGDLPLKLTSTNFSQFESGLDFTQLKPSFRHAMQVVQSLGISYIWIDCFCIIQGSDEVSRRDWAEQAGQMGHIYANGIINIGATAARSADDGCFVIRNRNSIDWVSVCEEEEEEEEELYQITQARYYEELDEEPLLCRAWVIQERHLCSRMLHFGNQQVFWQCATLSMASELAPRGLDVRGAAVDIAETLLAPGEISNGDIELGPLKRKHAWDWILASYCDAGLSFPEKDKLRAIAGLASYLAVKLGDDYHQGFFSRTLPQSLCWSTFSARLGKVDGKRRALERKLPTWSWSSMDGSLNFSNECDEAVQLLAAAIRPEVMSFNGTHGGDDGRMICIGRLVHASLFIKPPTYARRMIQFQEAYVGTPDWDRLFFFDDNQEMEAAKTLESGVFFFPISTNLLNPTSGSKSSVATVETSRERTSFLVLTKNSDSTFSRLGARRTLDDFSNKGINGSWLESYWKSRPRLIVII